MGSRFTGQRTSSTPRSTAAACCAGRSTRRSPAGSGRCSSSSGRRSTAFVRTTVPDGVVEVVNAEWRRGSATSFSGRSRQAAELGARRAVIALGDQPFITPEAWRAVAAADATVAVATYAGVRGHPVQLRAERLAAAADGRRRGQGGDAPSTRSRREIPCAGSAVDIDTVEDLRRWQNKLVNEFTVNRPIDEAWAVITDVERIAAVPAGRPARGDRGRRLSRCRQGQARLDHPAVQGPGDVHRPR